MQMQNVGNWARAALALSVFSLACAIAFMAWQVRQTIVLIEHFQPLMPVLLHESKGWRVDVEKAITLAQQEVPNAVAALQSTRALLGEYTPATLRELAALRELLDRQLPLVLAQAQVIEAQMPLMLAEMAKVRAAIPPVLAESQALRREVPLMLTQADSLVDKASDAGQQASEGAIKGMFSGVIKMPFDFLLGASELFLGGERLSESEILIITQTADRLVERKQLGVKENYQAKSGLAGTVTFIAWYTESEGQQCTKLNVYGVRKHSKGNTVLLAGCPDEDQGWDYHIIK